ncbi:PLP-dependent aspartate aminotransferase family protein [soil metagenome]
MTTEKRTASSTDAVHAGVGPNEAFDSVPTPLVQTSTYTFRDSAEIVALTTGTHERPHRDEYGRYGNPTCRAVEERLAALEATDDAVLFSSGMAAVTTTILALVKQGQHVVLFRDCYRMTREFVCGTLASVGVTSTLVPAGDIAAMKAALRPETRLVVSEAPSNPYLRCVDLAALAEVCKPVRGLRTMIDATFATPIHCRPADFGIDLVVHSATKYLAGHHDVLAGAVCAPSHLTSLVRDLRGVLGNVLDPHAAFLVARGMKTLALRMRQHPATALEVASFLEGHPKVERVHYPGLASHPDHAIAARQMNGFGGVVSFVAAGGLDGARRVVDGARLARIAPSLGGPETLIEQPAVMSFYEMTPEERHEAGIEDGLIRLAVGLEEPADVIADLRTALG